MGVDCMLIAKHKGKQEFTTAWLDRLYYFGYYGDSIEGIETDKPLKESDLRDWVAAVQCYAKENDLAAEFYQFYVQSLEYKLKLIIKFLDALKDIDVEYIVLSDDSGGQYYDLVSRLSFLSQGEVEHKIEL